MPSFSLCASAEVRSSLPLTSSQERFLFSHHIGLGHYQAERVASLYFGHGSVYLEAGRCPELSYLEAFTAFVGVHQPKQSVSLRVLISEGSVLQQALLNSDVSGKMQQCLTAFAGPFGHNT